MKWNIVFSRESLHFITDNHLDEKEIIDIVINSVKKISGDDINIDIKKLKGNWTGFHRIRYKKIRIIVEFNFNLYNVFIERIDFRGEVYR
jgi:mRNA-degrading endonuclease RelE of RelBE toxin-antitoxin system